MQSKERARLLSVVVAVAQGAPGCGARAGLDEGPDEGSVTVDSVATVAASARQVLSGTLWDPGVEQFTCGGDFAAHCEKDEDCCFHRCARYRNGLGDVVAQCYGYAPPNAPCGAFAACASTLCSHPCAVDDHDCRGVCLPSLPGSRCRFDADCMVGRCLPGGNWVSGAGYCEMCETDAECPGSYCNVGREYDNGWCESWREAILKIYTPGGQY